MSPGLQSIPSTSFQLELRNSSDESKMDTCSYSNVPQASNFMPNIHQPPLNYQNTPIAHHAHHILNIHNHRSLTNSPISNPGSPGLDMIQEEVPPHLQPLKQDLSAICHPQISVTDVLGSEVTLVASSDTSEDSMDSLDNQRLPKIPSFIISEPPQNQPSITKGIGRKTSTESTGGEEIKFQSKPSNSEEEQYMLRRNSDKSSCYSDDSLSNDSLSIGNQSPSSSSHYSHLVSESEGTDKGTMNQNFEKMQINQSELTDTYLTQNYEGYNTNFDNQNFNLALDLSVGAEYKRKESDASVSHTFSSDSLNQSSESNSSFLVSDKRTLITFDPEAFENSQKNFGSFEVELSEVCSKLEPTDILEMVKQTINNQLPPKCCELKSTSEDICDKLSLEYEGGLQIELKICEDKQRESKGLKVRRISGDHLVYNQLCQQLISCMTVS